MLNKVYFNRKIFLFYFIFLVFFIFSGLQAEKLKCESYEDKILEQDDYDEIVKICDQEIELDKKSLKKKEEETSGVTYEIKKLDSNIRISQAFINKKNAKANRIKNDIGKTEKDIKKLGTNLGNIDDLLRILIFRRNQIEANTGVEVLLSKGTFSEFFEELNTTNLVEKKISQQIKKIKTEKNSLERLTLELEEREYVERELIESKRVEREKIKKNKKEKDILLKILKKEVGVFKVSIEDKVGVKQEILSRKFTVASGDKVSFGEAYNIINPYKKILGMDPAFILAVLFQESGYKGKIGGNIGQCFYNQRNKYGNFKNGYSIMRNSQKSAFLEIMKGLRINPNEQKVSCPIPSDGAYGGAMGPAQFIPTTWLGIRNSASKIINKTPKKMSPFVNRDSFIASATYLKIQYYSKACSNYSKKYRKISSDRTLRERCASSRYYAGTNWFKFRWKYGEPVVKRANRFRNDIKTLNS